MGLRVGLGLGLGLANDLDHLLAIAKAAGVRVIIPFIDNWRWAGVPFYIRTGKRLAESEASIVVNFRPTPHAIFNSNVEVANKLVIHLQPRDGLELHLLAQGQANRGTRGAAAQTLAPMKKFAVSF